MNNPVFHDTSFHFHILLFDTLIIPQIPKNEKYKVEEKAGYLPAFSNNTQISERTPKLSFSFSFFFSFLLAF